MTEEKISTHIQVLLKRAYGKERYYPLSDDAKIICSLMNRCSLTQEQLQFCVDNGWKVTVHQEAIEFKRREFDDNQ